MNSVRRCYAYFVIRPFPVQEPYLIPLEETQVLLLLSILRLHFFPAYEQVLLFKVCVHWTHPTFQRRGVRNDVVIAQYRVVSRQTRFHLLLQFRFERVVPINAVPIFHTHVVNVTPPSHRPRGQTRFGITHYRRRHVRRSCVRGQGGDVGVSQFVGAFLELRKGPVLPKGVAVLSMR